MRLWACSCTLYVESIVHPPSDMIHDLSNLITTPQKKAKEIVKWSNLILRSRQLRSINVIILFLWFHQHTFSPQLFMFIFYRLRLTQNNFWASIPSQMLLSISILVKVLGRYFCTFSTFLAIWSLFLFSFPLDGNFLTIE